MMERVLVVSTSRSREALSGLLREYGLIDLCYAYSGGEARRFLQEEAFEVVVINAPLQDEFGTGLSVEWARKSSAGVVLLVRAESAEDVTAGVEDYGVFVVQKPFSRPLLFQALKLVKAAHRRMAGLRQENVRLQNKLEESRQVSRAKCTLMQYLGMTEAQAHRYIEKQAMDLRITRGEVAQNVLRTYEN